MTRINLNSCAKRVRFLLWKRNFPWNPVCRASCKPTASKHFCRKGRAICALSTMKSVKSNFLRENALERNFEDRLFWLFHTCRLKFWKKNYLAVLLFLFLCALVYRFIYETRLQRNQQSKLREIRAGETKQSFAKMSLQMTMAMINPDGQQLITVKVFRF